MKKGVGGEEVDKGFFMFEPPYIQFQYNAIHIMNYEFHKHFKWRKCVFG